MAWGGTGRTNLHVFRNGIVNARRYLEDVVEAYIVSFFIEEGPDYIIQHDNAKPHTARLVTQHLQENNIEVSEWSANALDLNLIKYICDVLQRRLRYCQDVENIDVAGGMEQYSQANY